VGPSPPGCITEPLAADPTVPAGLLRLGGSWGLPKKADPVLEHSNVFKTRLELFNCFPGLCGQTPPTFRAHSDPPRRNTTARSGTNGSPCSSAPSDRIKKIHDHDRLFLPSGPVRPGLRGPRGRTTL